jgi:hypothetical protein
MEEEKDFDNDIDDDTTTNDNTAAIPTTEQFPATLKKLRIFYSKHKFIRHSHAGRL